MFRPLIRIRSQRWAWAAFLVSPASPAFAATYGARNDCPPWESIEMMLTMVPGCAALPHVGDGGLHQEERGPQVDRDVLVEQFRGGVQQGAAGGQPGGVDQAVDPPVPLDRRRDRGRRPAPRRLTSACTKLASAPAAVSSAATCSPRSALRPATTTAAPSRAAARAIAGAQALGAAADQHHLAGQQVLHRRLPAAVAGSPTCPNRGWRRRPGRGRPARRGRPGRRR